MTQVLEHLMSHHHDTVATTHLDPGVVPGVQRLQCSSVLTQHGDAVMVTHNLVPTDV